MDYIQKYIKKKYIKKKKSNLNDKKIKQGYPYNVKKCHKEND